MSKPVFCLSSFEQEGRCHVRIASTVQGTSMTIRKRLFIWCSMLIKKSRHSMKSLWRHRGSKVGAVVAQFRKQEVCCLRLSVAMNLKRFLSTVGLECLLGGGQTR